MSRIRQRCAAYFLTLAGVCVFLVGFFPHRVALGADDDDASLPGARTTCPVPPPTSANDTKLVVVIIDGWRSDFFFGNRGAASMPFLTGSGGFAVECVVQHPTVTMPRLKAVLAGIVPSYLDVALNFASSRFDIDNWLSRAISAGRRAVFYGDDTWLTMFPGFFAPRSEGTVSFFVTDYTEVDDNVTRHLGMETRDHVNTWDILILHYLGLDHIGHSVGGKTPLIDEKLGEMDGIIANIYRNLSESTKSPFTIVVLGDHGMATEGGHGGTTYRETHVPVVFLSSEGQNDPKKPLRPLSTVVQQVDLVPTLSAILGQQIPTNSLGVSFADRFLRDSIHTSWHLWKNARQLIKLAGSQASQHELKLILEDCLAGLEVHLCKGNPVPPELLDKCRQELWRFQFGLIHSSSEYSYSKLAAGWLIVAVSAFLAIRPILPPRMPSLKDLLRLDLAPVLVFIQPLAVFASSFVEYERRVWFFLLSTVLVLSGYRQMCKSRVNLNWTMAICLLAALAFHRVASSFVFNTIVKLLPTIAAQHGSVFIAAGLLHFLHSGPLPLKVISTISLFSERFALPPTWWSLEGGLLIAFYLSLAIHFLLSDWRSLTVFWVVSLTSPVNRVVLVIAVLLGRLLAVLPTKQQTPAVLLAACSAAFYYTGNSHSLASLDLASAYTRLPFYNFLLCGFQLFLVMYSAPLTMAIAWSRTANSESIESAINWLLLQRTTALATCLTALVIHRHHLFVWSVFAPKAVFDVLHFGAAGTITIVAYLAMRKYGVSK